MATSPTPLRRELLGSFTVLFAGALVLAGVGLLVTYPLLRSPAEATLYLTILLAGDLAVVFLFGRALLRRSLLKPLDRLVEDTRRISEGDYRHRARLAEARELREVGRGVNAMADRLIRDQERLAENVESLEETNRELVRTRDQLVRAARLASAGTLAAGIAHEVGNPLGAILAYVDAARKRARQAGMDVEILDDIRQEALRIDRIVRGLLDYARPDGTGREVLHPRVVVDRVRDLLDAQGRLDPVRSTWVVEDGVPEIRMNPHRLEHVLVNLLLNSVELAEEGRAEWIGVRVSSEPGRALQLPVRREEDPPEVNYAHRRRVTPEKEGGEPDPLWTAERVVILSVEDDGPGIPPGELEQVFDPFFTTRQPGQGTGLGLSVCARLVQGMGGRIDAENRDQGGARFVVRLPAHAPGPESTGSRDGAAPSARAGADAGSRSP